MSFEMFVERVAQQGIGALLADFSSADADEGRVGIYACTPERLCLYIPLIKRFFQP